MPSEHVPAALRRQVRIRARGLCEYCRCPALFTNASFHCEQLPLVRLAARQRWTISPGHARGVTPTNIPKLALLTHRRGALYHSSTRVVSVGSGTSYGARTTSSFSGVLPQAERPWWPCT